ncbi:MAG TPA: hypothetical protein VGM13_05540 [Thermoanaerobaculia bacterium]
MSGFWGAVAAQASVETRMRLRAPATLVAVLLLGSAAVLWIPDPAGKATSLSWKAADGRLFASTYSTRYLSWAAAIVGSIWASLAGFYLVAGSIRRDRERGVGAILAATPLPDGAYLAGKAAAHLLYLGVLSLLAVGAACVAFVRWGVGPFRPFDFVTTWALFTLPALVVTAALAVLFDVTPVLRGRAGLVIWFFVFAALVSGLNARDEKGRVVNPPRVDPLGMATLEEHVARSLPGATAISSGLIFHDKPFERVAWPGPRLAPADAAWRGVSLLAGLLPLGFSLLFFDRFDPAHARRKRSRGKPDALFAPGGDAAPAAASSLAVSVAPAPSASRSVLADARLTWDSGGWVKWPLLVLALGSPFVPGAAFPWAAAALLLVLALAVSEVSAREDLAGTRGLVFAQPGVPASPALWKAGSVLVFTLAFGLPCAARAAAGGPGAAAAFLSGLVFTAGIAAGFGSLTGGGKLFLGVYTAVWYFAVNRLPVADFTGLFSEPSALKAAAFALAGAAAVGGALAAESRSRA